MGPRYFDSHAHFDGLGDEAADAVLARAREAGVARICAVGSSAASNPGMLALARRHPEQVVAAVGYDRDQLDPALRDMPALRELAAEPCVRAIGEVGLDYHYGPDTARQQRALFEQMLALALDMRRPVIVHARDADADALAMLRDFADGWHRAGLDGRAPGVLHCFTGGPEFAEGVLERGLMVSFSGIVTFRNAAPLREVAARIPAERLLIETDSPYLAPIPHRGETNEPRFVPLVAQTLAEARGVDAAAIAETTFLNAESFFCPSTQPTQESST